jgi:phosphoglycolate phosphatase
MLTTLIFDFDGTLVDSEGLINSIFFELKEEFGFSDISQQEIQKLKRTSFKQKMAYLKISPLMVPRIIRKVQTEMSHRLNQINWHPGILELLDQLKAEGFRLGILTSNTKQNVNDFLSMTQQTEIFDFIYSGRNIFGKDQDLKAMMKQQQLSKQELLYVGDEVRDIEACHKVGIDIAAVTWGFDSVELLKRAKPTFIVADAQEILSIVKSRT